LPIYGRYLWLKTKLAKKTNRASEKIILVFTNRYIIHLLVLAIGLLVVGVNVLAYETREDYGKNALIYKIVGLEDTYFTEDTSGSQEESVVYSYLEKNSQLQSEPASANTAETDDEIDQSAFELTQGGAALVKPELASTEEAKIGVKGLRNYKVAEGDTISSIAGKFDISVNTVLWANNLSLNSYIKPGQQLIIPPVSGVVHTVKKGDTLAKIAQSYKGELARIKDFNNLDDETALIAGEKIIVPGGIIVTARTPAYTQVVTTRTASPSTINVPVSGKMAWPNSCYRITQYYKGWRHAGVDIACPWGVAIRAAQAGKVIRVQYGRTGYGYNIIIDHGGGKQTLYGHLSRIDVEVGEWVEKGEAIAAEGSTGRSSGPHLHFEVRVGGSTVNPLSYIR